MLTYDDFIDLAKATPNEAADPDYPGLVKDWSDMRRVKGVPAEGCFWASWVSGGTQGGNCWGSGGHHAVEREPAPKLHGLEQLMLALDLRYSEALAIFGDVQVGKETEGGYYGNSTEYGFKFVTFDAIYDRLVEFGHAAERSHGPRG